MTATVNIYEAKTRRVGCGHKLGGDPAPTSCSPDCNGQCGSIVFCHNDHRLQRGQAPVKPFTWRSEFLSYR
jgi:hypothetical protein